MRDCLAVEGMVYRITISPIILNNSMGICLRYIKIKGKQTQHHEAKIS